MTDLILTEKHSVAMDFAKALGVKKKGEGCIEGNGYVITWAVGHLVTLCDPEAYDPDLKRWKLTTLPLIPETFEYRPIKKTYKQFKIVKDLLIRRDFQRVIIATDAGREGEVIARTILLKAGFTDKSRMLRFWTSQALVPDVVRQAMENLKPLSAYDRLWRAGYYRQVADWLIGINCTRVLTVRLKDLFSVGRVQTAVLALLTARKKERDEFTPTPYWTLEILFANDKGRWKGQWFKNKETRLTDPEKARALTEGLRKETAPATVTSVSKERKRELPPLLFSLTDLQQEANKRFGFPAKKTLDIAQSLYQDKKCLSYPRTDARVLGSRNLDMIQAIIENFKTAQPAVFFGVDERRVSLDNKRVFNDAKLTDHHALIPLKPLLKEKASSDQKRLFDLVVRRFAAAFHGDCQFENTRVVTCFGGETFLTRGKVILEKGWRQVTGENKKEGQGDLPPLAQGDKGTAEKIRLDTKQTQPPPEYTDALLLKAMTNPGRYVSQEDIKRLFRGDIGIGTQSTRAQIIEILITRKYVARDGKTLRATEKGCYLVDSLRNCPVSSVLTSPEETARWEMDLNRIALGDQRDAKFLVNIKTFVARAVEELKTTPFEVKTFGDGVSVIPGRCPACGSEIHESRKAYNCVDKACKFVIWKKIAGKTISPHMAANLLKYRKSGPFNGFYSKKKKRFSASLVIEKTDGQWQVAFSFSTPSVKSDAKPETDSSLSEPHPLSGLTCPVCGGGIIEGKKGVGCANWPKEKGNCRFVIWKRISKKTLTLKNMATLLAGKTTRAYVFRNKAGQKYKARLKMTYSRGSGAVIRILPQDDVALDDLQVPCSR